jgi:hypothetical protein
MPDLIPKLISIFAWAFFSFWSSIPGGIALGVPPLLVGITAWLSYSTGAILIAVLGQPIRERLMKRFGGSMAGNPNSPIRRAWDRFGLIGLSLLAPLTTGSQIGAAIGLSLGVTPRRLIFGMAIGGAIWAAIITSAIMLGVSGVQAIR